MVKKNIVVEDLDFLVVRAGIFPGEVGGVGVGVTVLRRRTPVPLEDILELRRHWS